MCEKCGEIYLNLHAAGYCLMPDEDMRIAIAEYWLMTGVDPVNYEKVNGSQGGGGR